MPARSDLGAALAVIVIVLTGATCSKIDAALGSPNPDAVAARPEKVSVGVAPAYDSAFVRDATGATVLTPTATGPKATRRVYVSSSAGNDTNDGLSPATAVRSLEAGTRLLRDGHPDWLLLKRGDVWQESLYLNRLSGVSAKEPLVVTGYGEGARPLLKTGLHTGVGFHPDMEHHHIAVVGLSMHAHLRDPAAPGFDTKIAGFDDNAGLSATTTGGNLLIEDCTFRHYNSGLVAQDHKGGKLKDIEVRRNRFLDIWVSGEGFSQGVYMANVDGILLEENFFDVIGHNPAAHKAGTVFNHAGYLQNGTNGQRTVVRGNFISRSDGIQMREGGLAEDNFFFQTWIALTCGGGNDSTPGGVVCIARNNVFIDGADINANDKRGWALYVMNLKAPSDISGNIVAHNVHGTFPFSIHIGATRKDDDGDVQKVRAARITKNVVYGWGGTALWQGDANQLRDVVFEDNVLESTTQDPLLTHDPKAQLKSVRARGNRFFNAASAERAIGTGSGSMDLEDWAEATGDGAAVFEKTSFIDPSRDLDRYAREVAGVGSALELLGVLRSGTAGAQAEKHRAAPINRWIRAGFARR